SGSAPNGGEIESYVWDFGDNFTKTGEIVTHAYSTEGTFSVVLNVTDTEGLWDTSIADITVYAIPPVDFPPQIISVFRVPEEPNYDEYVRILASVIDIEGEVELVILGYSTNSIDWTNQTMTFNPDIGFYTAEIPPQPYNTTVNYKVYASDNNGNWNVSKTYTYKVADKYLPIVEIAEPTEGSYLRGLVNITVSVQEDNLVEAKLTINGTVVSSWHESGTHVFTWNTSSPDYPDATYTIKLSALDEAGHWAEKTVTVTVDNTLPTAAINAPSEGAFLRGTVIIEITGDDANLDKMELKINDLVIETWSTGGKHFYLWNTKPSYADGTYRITLAVYDKAGNSKEASVTTVVDNTPPTIEPPAWKPEEPFVDEQVNITVKVSDIQPGSGIRNVTLWYRNTTTMGDWQPISMSLNVTSGNWTATIPAQPAETTIQFYVEAFDKAGNKAVTDKYEYEVATPAGIPLLWIVAIILLILAATAVALYLWRKRRRKKQGVGSRA
ncbi:MAG: PKD domain-containing protein, partial [Candidatus Bathyarchaeia archaeon]